MPSGTDEHESHSSVSLLRVRECADENNTRKNIKEEDSWGIVWLSPESTHTGVLLGTIHATHTYMRRLIKPVVAVSESGLFGVRGWGRVCPAGSRLHY